MIKKATPFIKLNKLSLLNNFKKNQNIKKLLFYYKNKIKMI